MNETVSETTEARPPWLAKDGSIELMRDAELDVVRDLLRANRPVSGEQVARLVAEIDACWELQREHSVAEGQRNRELRRAKHQARQARHALQLRAGERRRLLDQIAELRKTIDSHECGGETR